MKTMVASFYRNHKRILKVVQDIKKGYRVKMLIRNLWKQVTVYFSQTTEFVFNTALKIMYLL